MFVLSFVPVFSAFLIICIESLVFVCFFFLHFWLSTFKILIFVVCFVTLPPGFRKTGPQSDIQVSCGLAEQQSSRNYLQRVSIPLSLNIRPNYNYLHKIIYIRIKTKAKQKLGWAQRLSLIKSVGNGMYKKRHGSIGDWEALMNVYSGR